MYKPLLKVCKRYHVFQWDKNSNEPTFTEGGITNTNFYYWQNKDTIFNNRYQLLLEVELADQYQLLLEEKVMNQYQLLLEVDKLFKNEHEVLL